MGNKIVFDVDTHRPTGTYYGEMRIAVTMQTTKNVYPTDQMELVKDGESRYSVVYQSGNAEMEYGANQFVKYFNQATGITLDKYAYSNLASVGDNSIVIGVQPALDKGLDLNKVAKSSDYVVCNQQQAIFIYGKTGYGVLNGVYALLDQLFNLEIFYTDTYTIDSVNGNLILDNVEIVGERTFDYLWSGSGELRPDRNGNSLDYSHQLGFVTDYYCQNGSVHNALVYVPYQTYKTSHPEWFYTGTISSGSATGMQLYLAVENFSTATGSLVATVAEAIWNNIVNDSLQREIYTFSQMDIDIWPTGVGYENSDALFNKYGTRSAEQIMFVNAVAQVIEQKIALNPIGRKITLQMLAYNKALVAPNLNKAGLTEQDKQAVQLHNGANVKVVPYVAP